MKIFLKDFQGVKIFKNLIIDLPTSKKISYNWGFGSVLGLFLSIQLIRGILLRMNYVSDIIRIFYCLDRLNRDILYAGFRRVAHGVKKCFFKLIKKKKITCLILFNNLCEKK